MKEKLSEIEGTEEGKMGSANAAENNDLLGLGGINGDPAVQQIYGAKRKAYIETANPAGGAKQAKADSHEKKAKEKEVSRVVVTVTKRVGCHQQLWAGTAHVQDQEG